MSPENKNRRVRRRDARMRRKRLKSGKRSSEVRWIEDIDGVPTRISKSFSSEDEAQKFMKACRVKIGIVHTVKSMMADQMRPSADMSTAIPDFVEETRLRCIERSVYPEQLTFYLNKLLELGWTRSHEIPANACDTIAAKLGHLGTYTVRETQRALKSFVKSREKTYAFIDGICDGKLCKHKVTDYYIWLDEEKNLILKALTAPLRYPDDVAHLSPRKRRAARHSARCAFYNRRALFPVIWIQMLWALRPNETALLRAEHWHPRTNELVLTKDITKTKAERSFVVDRVTAAMLNCLTNDLGPDELVFRTAYGRKWDGYNEMSRQFRTILRGLRIRGSLYSCRHYAVTTLVELMPGKLRSVMAISGHTRLESVARYLGLKGNRQLPAAGIYDHIYDEVLRRVKPAAMEIPMPSASAEADDRDDPEEPSSPVPAPSSPGPRPSSVRSVTFVVEEE